jgi:hypothetical protein
MNNMISRTWVLKCIAIGNVLAGIILFIWGGNLNKTIEVTYDRVPPLLKLLPRQQADYAERMLGKAQTQASDMQTLIWIIELWLIVSIVISWWVVKNSEPLRINPATIDYEKGPK